MSPYAVFMDIDGTLVDRSQQPTQATKDAVSRYRAAGHQFFIASGRPLFSAREMAERVAPGLNVICSNGSVTAVNGEVSGIHLSPAALAGIYHVAETLGVRATLFKRDGVINLDFPNKALSIDARHRIAGEDPARNITVHSAQELVAHAQEITNGICFEPDPTLLDKARQALSAYADLDLSSSNHDNIEITKHGVNKASAILAVCRRLNIPIERTMAFGDGDNDLQMLTTVNYGVAMGNANPTVKQATNYHTLDIHHDGVAHYLHEFFGSH